VVWTRYGPPEGLRVEDVPKPIPRADELLIKVHATAVTAGDCELRGLRFSIGLRLLVRLTMGLTRPRNKVLGQALAGEVEAVGRDVRAFSAGDPVFGTTGFRFGAYAEYICLPARTRGAALTKKPVNMSYDEAATVPTGGLEALHFLRRVGDLRGRKVLIVGAGGGIGSFALQLAKHFGAEVTGVDRTGKLDLMRAMGADRVVDFTRDEFTRREESYDVIFDVVGKTPLRAGLARLHGTGHYLLGNPGPSTMARGFWISRRGGKKVIQGASHQKTEDIVFLRELIEAGKIRTVIDRRFPLEGVPDAHRYFDAGLACGSVVIYLQGEETGEGNGPAPMGLGFGKPNSRPSEPHAAA
jgi:NADPH:quinone reductase-like Zn-dependent oxidoreductase